MQKPSSWCNSRGKRLMDVLGALGGLVLTSPALLGIALLIRATSKGPALFRQPRLGQNGRCFELLKFRTMRMEAPSNTGVTRAGDPRVTWTGRLLRATKLDELPQLINVLRGDMSLVGPRPDLECFWCCATATTKQVLQLKPGITGAASLVFRNEEELLRNVPSDQLHDYYLAELLPAKSQIDWEYGGHASFWGDCKVLLKTAVALFRKPAAGKVARQMSVPSHERVS